MGIELATSGRRVIALEPTEQWPILANNAKCSYIYGLIRIAVNCKQPFARFFMIVAIITEAHVHCVALLELYLIPKLELA